MPLSIDTPVKDALAFIRAKGFKFIKIELEGQLDRSGGCDGHECEDCGGSGWWEDDNGEDMQCEECEGNGNFSCEYVDCTEGEGWSNSKCQEFIDNAVTPKTRRTTAYRKFYKDGSVDSELTFTVPISQNGLSAAWQYIKAFKKLAKAVGNGLDVSGAGMHIALLNDPQGRYRGGDTNEIDSRLYANFEREVRKLLPALYFLGTYCAKTRPIGFRNPTVSGQDKYSAIARRHEVLEFRVFDPCYDKPEAILDYIQVISKCLYFYSNKTVNITPPKQLKILYGHHLARFYMEPEQLRWLDKALPYLKPDNKSIKQLKRERNFTITPEHLKKLKLRKEYQFRADWPIFKAELKNKEREIQRNVHKVFEREYMGSTPSAAYIQARVSQQLTSQPKTLRAYLSKRDQNSKRYEGIVEIN